ncbi:hypothetical protein [Bosea sp. AS-1]|uniref:hypothetical protein n=1 Tax=Bosea sp. AS-1 TaxID=2015316 RepID=UPI000B7767A0|nr:hypothetical protein [Bosea sp. AS-1]
MTPEAYRAALQRLGYNQTTIAPLLGVTQRTSQRYAADGAPEYMARLLAYIERYGVDLAKEMGK